MSIVSKKKKKFLERFWEFVLWEGQIWKFSQSQCLFQRFFFSKSRSSNKHPCCQLDFKSDFGFWSSNGLFLWSPFLPSLKYWFSIRLFFLDRKEPYFTNSLHYFRYTVTYVIWKKAFVGVSWGFAVFWAALYSWFWFNRRGRTTIEKSIFDNYLTVKCVFMKCVMSFFRSGQHPFWARSCLWGGWAPNIHL